MKVTIKKASDGVIDYYVFNGGPFKEEWADIIEDEDLPRVQIKFDVYPQPLLNSFEESYKLLKEQALLNLEFINFIALLKISDIVPINIYSAFYPRESELSYVVEIPLNHSIFKNSEKP